MPSLDCRWQTFWRLVRTRNGWVWSSCDWHDSPAWSLLLRRVKEFHVLPGSDWFNYWASMSCAPICLRAFSSLWAGGKSSHFSRNMLPTKSPLPTNSLVTLCTADSIHTAVDCPVSHAHAHSGAVMASSPKKEPTLLYMTHGKAKQTHLVLAYMYVLRCRGPFELYVLPGTLLSIIVFCFFYVIRCRVGVSASFFSRNIG